MRLSLRSFPFCVPLLIPFAALNTSLFAQAPAEDDGTLFFPPQLAVEATSILITGKGCFIANEYTPGIIVTEQINKHSLPLLPIIFFDGPRDANIPQRYNSFTTSFDALDYVATLPVVDGKDVEKYYQILNIIGQRLSNTDKAMLLLQGGYSTEPGETAEVGRQRAETVRDYLVNIWRIDPKRIEVLLPQRMCDSATPLPGQEEARCVRMYSTDEELFAPINATIIFYKSDGLQLDIGIETHLIEGDATAIDIDVILGDSLLSSDRISCRSASPFHRLKGTWNIPDFKFNARPHALSVRARVHRQNGNVRTSNIVTIPITYNSSTDSAEPPLTLPFFHYRDTALTPHQRVILNRILQKHREGNFQYILTGKSEHSEAENGEAWLISKRRSQRGTLKDTRVFVEEILPGESHYGEVVFFRTPTENSEGITLPIEVLPLDSLDADRGAAVGVYIYDHTQHNALNSSRITIKTSSRRTFFYDSNYPEQRYYNRYVYISVAKRPAKTYVNYGAKIEE